MFRATTPARGLTTRRPLAASALAPCALAACAVAAAAGACRDLTAPAQDPTAITYAPKLNIQLSDFTRDTSGVYYQDLAVGSGVVADTGRVVRYFYTGYLSDGRQFGTNRTSTAALPDTFVVGRGAVVRGFDRGLRGVRGGSRRRLIIPPALGYGGTTRGTAIPAGSVLIFEVDVAAVVVPPAPTPTPTSRARP